MVSTNGNGTTLLRAVKPFKTGWKVEIKALHSWTQHSTYSGRDSFDFILADKTVSYKCLHRFVMLNIVL